MKICPTSAETVNQGCRDGLRTKTSFKCCISLRRRVKVGNEGWMKNRILIKLVKRITFRGFRQPSVGESYLFPTTETHGWIAYGLLYGGYII